MAGAPAPAIAMADNPKLFERVEVFSRATSDALNRAIGDVLAARGPMQLLYRLSRIVLLGLVLYTAWLLITLQPDLARRMRSPVGSSLPQQVAAHQQQVQTLLRSSVRSRLLGLHTLVVLEWGGGNSFQVLAAYGRHEQLGLVPGGETVVGVAMAPVLGHVAMGLCASERVEALIAGTSLANNRLLLCPIGCSALAGSNNEGTQGLLLALFHSPTQARGSIQANPKGAASTNADQLERQQQDQLSLISRHLGEILGGS